MSAQANSLHLQSLFSSPIFSWGDNSLPVVNAASKYYWVLAIPLTLLVFVLWAVTLLLEPTLDDVLRREFDRITH
jgi:hypothetical protein